MIKLTKSNPAPVSLSSEACKNTLEAVEQKMRNREKVTAKDYGSLYGATDTRKQLRDDQGDKCAYCEKSLLDEQRHVEHYRPKALYPSLAFTWDNLLGACWACNLKKSNCFPLADETVRGNIDDEQPLLINPYIDDPSEFFEFHEEEIRPKKGLSGTRLSKAQNTIDTILNRPDLKERRRKAWVDYNQLNILLQSVNPNHPAYEKILSMMNEFRDSSHEFSAMFNLQQ